MEKDIMIKDFNVSEKGHGSYWPLGRSCRTQRLRRSQLLSRWVGRVYGVPL